MNDKIMAPVVDGYICIGDLRIDTRVYLSRFPAADGDKLFRIVCWKDKEQNEGVKLELSGRELEKLHRLVKQFRKRDEPNGRR